MFLKKNATWTLDLKDHEMTVVQKCLRGDELTEQEDAEAARISELCDRIVKERSQPKKAPDKLRLTTNG